METIFSVKLALLLLSVALFLLLWAVGATFVSIRKMRKDVADISWGLSILGASWIAPFFTGFTLYGLIVNLMVTLWALRLSYHIYQKHQLEGEDFRYAAKATSKWRVFIDVYLLQAFFQYIVVLPVLAIHFFSDHIPLPFFILGFAVWLFGFFFEAISDWQLLRFRKNKAHRGVLYHRGLWSLSRHPNYFGEMVQWWAVWLIALPVPFGLVLALSPAILSYLICFVSGIAPVEKRMKEKPEFEEYRKKTPVLFPTIFLNFLFFSLPVIEIWMIDTPLTPYISVLCSFTAQTLLFYYRDQRSFYLLIPLAVYGLILGFLHQVVLIHFQLTSYATDSPFPPASILFLYPMGVLMLNSAAAYLNRHMIAVLVIGVGVGSAAYQKLALPMFILRVATFEVLFVYLVLLNRRLDALYDKYCSVSHNRIPLKLFFDGGCPVCSREIGALKRRGGSGSVEYIPLTTEANLREITEKFSFEQAMKQIHAIEGEKTVLRGTEALSAVYARTGLPILAIILQAPGFKELFRVLYKIWARFRIRIAPNLS